jgi:hypothetical protein
VELIESFRRFDLDQAVDASEALDEFHVGWLYSPRIGATYELAPLPVDADQSSSTS